MKLHIKTYLFVLATMLVGLASCSEDQVGKFFFKRVKAPGSTIERDVKGHDQIYAVHAILRMGYKGGTIAVGPNGNEDISVYNTYQSVADSLSLPIFQEIDISKDDNGQMVVTTMRDHFDVVASDNICYGLELKYYDQNGMLINHQFSSYLYKKDKNGNLVVDDVSSALPLHQHFFCVGNYTLNHQISANGGTKVAGVENGIQQAYPRSLDSLPMYYDRYTFKNANGDPVASTKISASNIYAPSSFTWGNNQVAYHPELAWRAIEVTGTPQATEPYTYTDGKEYRLFQAIENTRLNELTPELFTYEYRDTDPVEENIGKLFEEYYNDDFIDPYTNLPRQRYSNVVGLLRQERSLDTGMPLDRLGFKGILRFQKADVAFQLQVRMCNILTKGLVPGSTTERRSGKYTNPQNVDNGYLWDFNQIQSGWDNYDIDFPLPVRVIADTRDGKEKCNSDIQRFYPQANLEEVWQMLTQPQQYFNLIKHRSNVVFM